MFWQPWGAQKMVQNDDDDDDRLACRIEIAVLKWQVLLSQRTAHDLTAKS